MKAKTTYQAKQITGVAMLNALGVEPEFTKSGKLTAKSYKELNRRGYYWFPSQRTWKPLG